jgi:hypothetical protein
MTLNQFAFCCKKRWLTAASSKQQAASSKQQAASSKQQAAAAAA